MSGSGPGRIDATRLWAMVVWAIALAVVLAVAIPAALAIVQPIDDSFWALAVENDTTFLVNLAKVFDLVGSGVVMGPLMVVVALFLAWRRRWSGLVVWVLAMSGSQLTSTLLKQAIARPRPPLPLVETELLSFPSGHTLTTAVFGITLAFLVVKRLESRRRWLVGTVAFSAAMAWSRVYVRAHWLTDVAGGMAIGAGFGLLAVILLAVMDDSA